MDAIIIAGGIPQPVDPLYAYSKGDAKALIELAGKPMIQWVLDALNGASQVDNIILIGLSPKTSIQVSKPVHYISNQGRMLANIIAGINKARELNAQTQYVLIASSDIPAIKAHMVDWLITTALQTRGDLYYGVCPRAVMEKRFPSSKRTYTKFRDIELCGGDMHIAHVRLAGEEYHSIWETLIERRKNPLSQAAAMGLGTAISLFTGRLTLADAVDRVCNRIGIKGRPIIWEYAEPAMDVDKPHQLELLRADLIRQQRRAAGSIGKKKGTKKKSVKKTTQRKRKPVSRKPVRKRVAKRSKPAIRKKTTAKSRRRRPLKRRVKSRSRRSKAGR